VVKTQLTHDLDEATLGRAVPLAVIYLAAWVITPPDDTTCSGTPEASEAGSPPRGAETESGEIRR